MELFLEYLAFGSSLLSAWLYGNKGYKGPIAGLFTCVAFMMFGYVTGIYAAVISNVVFMAVHSRNLRKVWLMDEDRKKKRMTEFFQQFQKDAHAASYDAGWWHCPIEGDSYLENKAKLLLAIPAKLMLMVSEVAEAMEADRKDMMDDKLPHRSGVECEMADAIIRIMDLGGALGLDVGGAIAEKMAFNAVRPDHKIENRRKPGGKKY